MGVALRAARRHVANFAEEWEIAKSHREAMECRDVEAVLQLGIDAFAWLTRADEYVRAAVYRGMEYDAEADESLRELFKEWLRPCEPLNRWIETQIQRGYHPDNLDQFRKCETDVRSIVKAIDTDAMTEALRDLRDQALEEHRRGETAEFV